MLVALELQPDPPLATGDTPIFARAQPCLFRPGLRLAAAGGRAEIQEPVFADLQPCLPVWMVGRHCWAEIHVPKAPAAEAGHLLRFVEHFYGPDFGVVHPRRER